MLVHRGNDPRPDTALRLLDQRLNAPLGDIDGVLVSEGVDCR